MDITLALSGGGARGAAHLGVLRVLEKQGFCIRAVAGTSIGSVVGAFYAFGYTTHEIENLFATVDLTRLYGWPLSEGPALLGIRGIADFLRTHLGHRTFDDLKLPFAAVAVDLNSRREIILREGRVVDALLGSIAVPGIFPPKELNEYNLVDGGTLDPVPVRAARALAPKLPVVAVSLYSPLDRPATPLTVPLPKPLAEQIRHLPITQVFHIMLEAVDIGQRQLTELRLKIDRPDALIQPEVDDIGILDTVDVGKIALLGERAALESLPQVRRAVSWTSRFARWLGRSRRNEC
jgi:NTE family protein